VNQCRRLTCGKDQEQKGQDSQKSNKCYFTYLGSTPAEPICPNICVLGDVPTGARKMADLKLADLKMTDQIIRKMGEMKLTELKMADQK